MKPPHEGSQLPKSLACKWTNSSPDNIDLDSIVFEPTFANFKVGSYASVV